MPRARASTSQADPAVVASQHYHANLGSSWARDVEQLAEECTPLNIVNSEWLTIAIHTSPLSNLF